MEIGDGMFEVKATSGDIHLGERRLGPAGHRLAGDSFKNTEGIDLAKDRMALQRLKEAAEKAKIELSQSTETTITLPYIT
jgi:molecular chaperone DnaK